MLIGEKGAFLEVPSTDYDTDLELVRYKDVIYDIPTGLWVVKLSHIQKDFSYWKGCGSFPDANMSSMMGIVKTNGIFKHRLAKQREKVHTNKLADVVNKAGDQQLSLL